mmetsp:Transcript_23307/g.59477  ORF Transcript_23307/g.59477 Transcript_23307/m.59477 type:complete len:270 (+) Transcript_23307:534-1343(+)
MLQTPCGAGGVVVAGVVATGGDTTSGVVTASGVVVVTTTGGVVTDGVVTTTGDVVTGGAVTTTGGIVTGGAIFAGSAGSGAAVTTATTGAGAGGAAAGADQLTSGATGMIAGAGPGAGPDARSGAGAGAGAGALSLCTSSADGRIPSVAARRLRASCRSSASIPRTRCESCVRTLLATAPSKRFVAPSSCFSDLVVLWMEFGVLGSSTFQTSCSNPSMAFLAKVAPTVRLQRVPAPVQLRSTTLLPLTLSSTAAMHKPKWLLMKPVASS